MWWVALFGAIVLLGIVLYAALGLWLWHRARALAGELDRALARTGAVLDGAAPDAALREVRSTETGGTHRGR